MQRSPGISAVSLQIEKLVCAWLGTWVPQSILFNTWSIARAFGDWGLHTNPSICKLSCLVLFLSTPLEMGKFLLRSGRTQGANGTGQPGAHPGPPASLFHTSVTGVCLWSFPTSFPHSWDSCFWQVWLADYSPFFERAFNSHMSFQTLFFPKNRSGAVCSRFCGFLGCCWASKIGLTGRDWANFMPVGFQLFWIYSGLPVR